MKIPKKEIQQWIDALRSGDYKQGQGTLETLNGLCCLGVACKLFIPPAHQKYQEDPKVPKSGVLHGKLPYDQPAAPEWLKDLDTDFAQKTDRYKRLTVLNDELGMSFDDIADLLQAVYIEEVLKEKKVKRG